MSFIVSKCASLLGGPFCPGNDVLFRDGLNPKARRKVCQVCDESDKGTAGVDVRPALKGLPDERARSFRVNGLTADETDEWLSAAREGGRCCRASSHFAAKCCTAAGCESR